MKSIFLIPTLAASAARQFTHISLWRRIAPSTLVCGFSREAGKKSNYQADVVLGEFSHGNLLSRIPVYKEALNRLIELVEHKDIIFVYTLDTFLFAWMAKTAARSDIKIVFFLLDIRALFVGSKLKNHIVQSFLLFAFKRCELIVVSSSKFIDEFSSTFVGENPSRWLEIENKVDARTIDAPAAVPLPFESSHVITVGYFGVLRCSRSLEILVKVAQKARGRIRIKIRGIVEVADFDAHAESVDALEYLGPYKNPEDLAEIYQQCDMIWACYPYGKEVGNHLWAKTNRYYEGGYFNRPLIASEGTADAFEVDKLGIGLVLDLSDVDAAVQNVLGIKLIDLQKWSQNLSALPNKRFAYSSEFEELFKVLA